MSGFIGFARCADQKTDRVQSFARCRSKNGKMPCKDPKCLGCDSIDLDALVAARMARDGFTIMWITDSPQFADTVGLTENNEHPEFIVTAQIGRARYNSLLQAAVKMVGSGPILVVCHSDFRDLINYRSFRTKVYLKRLH